MKYTIESTGHICVETIELSDGSIYKKEHTRTDFGSKCDDADFETQMRMDGICPEIYEQVSHVFDGFLSLAVMNIAEMEE